MESICRIKSEFAVAIEKIMRTDSILTTGANVQACYLGIAFDNDSDFVLFEVAIRISLDLEGPF